MRFRRKRRTGKGVAGGIAHVCERCIHVSARIAMALVSLSLIAGAILFFRLDRGPIHLTWGAERIQREINTSREDASISIGDLVLRLPSGSLKPVFEFRDVTIRTDKGAPIVSAPALRARFSLRDLIRGEIKPTKIVLIGPVAKLIRTREGRFRFGLGYAGAVDVTNRLSEGTALLPRRKVVSVDPGMGPVARIFAGFAGDMEPVEGLEKLHEISIIGARLTYLHVPSARIWRTKDTDLVVRRDATGLRAELRVSIGEENRKGATLVAVAERSAITRITTADLRIDGLGTAELATQVPGLEALQLIDAVVGGELRARLDPVGELTEIAGTINASDGTIFGIGEAGETFDSFSLKFRHTPGTDRVFVDELKLRAPATRTSLAGFADLERDDAGNVIAILGQVEVNNMLLNLPKLFSEDLRFSDGQIVGRIQLDPLEIRIADARLSDDRLTFNLNGIARQVGAAWQTDLRVAGRQISISQMISHWPLPAAVNARSWVAENLQSGIIDEMVAHLRIDQGEPQLNLDFRYSDLLAGYLGPMTPISRASGRGHLTLHEFYLFMDRGGVFVAPDERITLDGSKVAITDLWGEVTPADIQLHASGPTRKILGLINEQPLGLVSKLGLDPETIDGKSTMSASLRFPLLSDLLLEQIVVDVDARLFDVEMPLAFAGYPDLSLRAGELGLQANVNAMHLRGPVTVGGVGLKVDWNEIYGETPGRRKVAVETSLNPQLMRQMGLDLPFFTSGAAPASLKLAQRGNAPAEFDLDVNLGPAGLGVAELGWNKPAGAKARLRAQGRAGDSIDVSALSLDAPALTIRGAMSMDGTGDVSSVRLSRLVLRNQVDVVLDLEPDPNGGYDVVVGGRYLDVGVLDNDAGGGDVAEPAPPITISLSLDEIHLSKQYSLKPAKGQIHRTSSGDLVADVAGAINATAPVNVSVSAPAGKATDVFVESDDAGALLKTFGLLEESTGGKLDLRASIPADGTKPLTGLAKIRNLTVNEAKTFQIILREGGIGAENGAPQAGKLGFQKIRVPFSFKNEVITIGPSVATGPALALKLEGQVDQAARKIDLSGVVSPAYALSSALNNIPLLGRVLTGGEGEGILAMTFSVRGDLDNPEISVNPLTMLTPGFLRNIFSGKAKVPDQKFLDQLERN